MLFCIRNKATTPNKPIIIIIIIIIIIYVHEDKCSTSTCTCVAYRIAGTVYLEGLKFGELLFFCGWRILIWLISRHVSLSMCTVDENGGFNFGER